MSLSWEQTDHLLQEDHLYEPAADIVERSNVLEYMKSKGKQSLNELYRWTIEEPERFWEDQANELDWFAPWTKVLEWQTPDAKWFVDGKFNIVYNCLDRHMGTPVQNRVAYFWEGEEGSRKVYTYAELYRAVNRFASGLRRLGIQKGDRVCIYLPRIPEQIIAMLAVARIGAIHSVVFSGFSAQALRNRILDAEAKAVITVDGYYYRQKLFNLKAVVDEACRDLDSIEHVIVAHRANNPVDWVDKRDIDWHDVEVNQLTPCEIMDSEDPLYILYTSGSTGRPKGVVHVHGGYAVGVYTTTKFTFDIKPTDVFFCSADPGWVTGHSYIVYGPLMHGATSVFYEGAPTTPDPGRLWQLIERYGVTIFYTAPTAIRALMRLGDQWPAQYDLSSLRLLGSVGEPINPEAWQWYRRVTGGCLPILDTWWQTETGAHMITPSPAIPLKPGSATLPFLGIEADVVDRQGNPLQADAGGYLIIRNPWPSMMRTIHGDRARYESYWNTIPGVYFAGDACYRDPDGYFWIQGRVDDVINKSGHRLGSMEIESALVSHPDVAEAAVIGKPDETKGESIKAFVTLIQGVQASDELVQSLKQHVRQQIGAIAVPDEIEFSDLLPKTRSGKIMRRLLKAKELGLDPGDTSTLED